MSNPNHPAGDEVDPSEVDPSEGTLDVGAEPPDEEGEEEVDPSEKPKQ